MGYRPVQKYKHNLFPTYYYHAKSTIPRNVSKTDATISTDATRTATAISADATTAATTVSARAATRTTTRTTATRAGIITALIYTTKNDLAHAGSFFVVYIYLTINFKLGGTLGEPSVPVFYDFILFFYRVYDESYDNT